MSLNSRAARASAVQLLVPFILAPPFPNGSIDEADGPHAVHSYAGFTLVPSFDSQVYTTYDAIGLREELRARGTPLRRVVIIAEAEEDSGLSRGMSIG